MKNFFTLLILWVTTQLAFGQTSSIVITATGGENLKVFSNGIVVNHEPQTQVRIPNLAQGQYELFIEVYPANQPRFNLSKLAPIEFGKEYWYEVQRAGGRFVLYLAETRTLASAPNPRNNLNLPNTSPTTPQPDNQQGYSGPCGCLYPMQDQAFQQAKAAISNRSFDSSKLLVAKQITASNCLFATDIRDLMRLFSFESSRLEYAKFAYRYTYDLSNYFLVYDAFQFESSITDLSRYIRSLGPIGVSVPNIPSRQYVGPTGCQMPMAPDAFQAALQTIRSKSFDSTRLTVAKQIATTNCLTTLQIKEIVFLFSFESTRLEFAKFAYRYCYDLNNYFMVNDAFQYDSSVSQLNDYIRSGY